MPRVYVDRVVDDLYVLRIDDDEVKFFEALWYIPEGVTYNSYILVTEDGAVVFDSWKHVYADLFIDSIRKVVDPKDVVYVVVHHMEPDHSGAIPKLLEVNGYRATVVGHPIVKNLFKAFYGFEPRFKVVKDLDVMEFGGKKLRFIHIPWLHWPDTIATYIEDLGVLLTCDAFGGYGMPSTIYDDDEEVVKQYLPYARKYLASIVGHYREHIVKNIEKILSLGLDIKVVAPAHGLIWRRSPRTIVDYYYSLGMAKPEKSKILVVYGSMYGVTEKVMDIVINDVKSRGYNVKVYRFTDKEQAFFADILGDAIDSSAIIVGVPTYDGKMFPSIEHTLKLLIDKVNAEKPILFINIYGWGKVQENTVKTLLEKSMFKIIDIVNLNGLPKENDVERLRQAIDRLIQSIT